MFRLTFDVDGERQLDRSLDILARNLTDFTEIFKEIAEDFRATQKKVFANSGAFDGLRRWAPLSRPYASWKMAHYGNKPILTLTGRLRKSLTQKGAPSHIERITARTLEIGTDHGIGMLHQRGTRKMPKRKVIELSDSQKRRWVNIAHNEIFRNMTTQEMQDFTSR